MSYNIAKKIVHKRLLFTSGEIAFLYYRQFTNRKSAKNSSKNEAFRNVCVQNAY